MGQDLFVKDTCLGARITFCEGCPLEDVFEEVLWRGGLVSGSVGLGGPRTVIPLTGVRDVRGTTCRSLGDFIATQVFNSVFPQMEPLDALIKHMGPIDMDYCSKLGPG
ncbi:UNVERIFIED_CONTAM: hypothetical protein Slati_4506600 [Sesamum latifolium]|uniref:Uncharacterized protein n=1 Tax=Sesamum latifolium TaxID=2727402 RepID=A0AAW2STJ6_9LAMI